MKLLKYIIFLLIGFSLNVQSQIRIDTLSYSYLDGITHKDRVIDTYRITNNSNEEYLTWISLDSVNCKSNIDLVHDYFKKRKGDFSYMDMFYEHLLDEQPISIGYSFIKNIKKGETFSYSIAKTDTNSTFYQDRIVVMKRKEVEEYLRDKLDEKYFFKFSQIFLVEKSN